MELRFEPLGPEAAADYLNLFDNAFSDFKDWSGCYCAFYDTPGKEWEADSEVAAANRAAREARIRAGQASGVLAYAAAEAVGYCNAAARDEYVNLRRYRDVPQV